jgi:hypothetical protein
MAVQFDGLVKRDLLVQVPVQRLLPLPLRSLGVQAFESQFHCAGYRNLHKFQMNCFANNGPAAEEGVLVLEGLKKGRHRELGRRTNAPCLIFLYNTKAVKDSLGQI